MWAGSLLAVALGRWRRGRGFEGLPTSSGLAGLEPATSAFVKRVLYPSELQAYGR